MNARSPRGFVLLIVLVAAAVLSLIAAFIYTRTENQLVMSVASRGQSIAAARATLAAERQLAIYRANYPVGLTTLTATTDYATAVANGWTGDRQIQNLSKATWPALDVAGGGGANWCTESWLMNRGPSVPPWTVVEAFGFYGYTAEPPAAQFVNCNPQGNLRIVSSHITMYLETPPGAGAAAPNGGPGSGTGAVGGS
jgi:type II secretory pathway pseudopilin PulG